MLFRSRKRPIVTSKKSITRSDVGTSNISELETAIRECLFGKVAPAMMTSTSSGTKEEDEEEEEVPVFESEDVEVDDQDDLGF